MRYSQANCLPDSKSQEAGDDRGLRKRHTYNGNAHTQAPPQAQHETQDTHEQKRQTRTPNKDMTNHKPQQQAHPANDHNTSPSPVVYIYIAASLRGRSDEVSLAGEALKAFEVSKVVVGGVTHTHTHTHT